MSVTREELLPRIKAALQAAHGALPAAPLGQMTLRVNGKDHFIDPKKYRTLIEALRDLGYDIPHFCWHPGLEPDGNCRMCYVNLLDAATAKPQLTMDLSKVPFQAFPKPVISCREPLNPKGMVVETETSAVLEGRQWVMEFLLINHPLDCPVCDKAGECILQDNSYAHGRANSRFVEQKNEKPPKDLGPTIKLWTDRCILCSRCVRFLNEVSGTGELCIAQRGDRGEIDVMPGHPLDNPLMGNVVDLCPVGALIDKDLMYRYRAWYFRRTDSVCPACSKGCNIQVHSQREFVRRLVPRENREVNGWWMCDRGRKDFPYINAPGRLLRGRVDQQQVAPEAAADEAGRRLAEAARADPQRVAALASAWLTLEELHVLKTLFAGTLKSERLGLIAEPPGRELAFPKFRIEADRNPNRAGARLILGEAALGAADDIIAAAGARKLRALFIVSDMPHWTPPREWLDALAKVPLVIVLDLQGGPLTELAHIVIPGASFAEKDGVFVNVQGRAQVVRQAIDPLACGWNTLMLLQQVETAAAADAAKGRACISAREVFGGLGRHYPALQQMTYATLGRAGKGL